MMNLLQSIILGLIQGITEWLPISSSGHLVIFQKLMGVQVPVAFDVALHVGTLIPVLFIFRKEIWKILKGFLSFNPRDEEFRFGSFLLIATVITGLIGVSFLNFFESLFQSTLAVSIGLFITSLFLFASKFFKGHRKVGLKDSIIIGVAQGISIVPGISRSGLTISTGLISKIEKETILKYSFLLSVLAIIGAQLIELDNLVLSSIDLVSVLIGVLTAAISGYFAIRVVVKFLTHEKFYLFAIYCLVVGILVLFLI
jgi:undecaprenyl-diphosphatase